MTVAEVFDDHLKLAVRVHSGKSLRAGKKDPPTAVALAAELNSLEQSELFEERSRTLDDVTFQEAKYAVDALIDSFARRKFGKHDWQNRNSDPHVGHNFYKRIIALKGGNRERRQESLELYCLCELLGFPDGDPYLKNDQMVRQVIKEVAEEAAAKRCPVTWPFAAVPAEHNAKLATLHLWLRRVASVMALLYLGSLIYLYWIGWLNFPAAEIGN